MSYKQFQEELFEKICESYGVTPEEAMSPIITSFKNNAMQYISETNFDNLDGTCMCPFDYIEEHEKDQYRNNPPFVVQEMRIEDDLVVCANEHLWMEKPDPKKLKYPQGHILVGLWRVKYKLT